MRTPLQSNSRSGRKIALSAVLAIIASAIMTSVYDTDQVSPARMNREEGAAQSTHYPNLIPPDPTRPDSDYRTWLTSGACQK
jgi:hypothetical protein